MSFTEIGDNELLYLIRCDNYQAKQVLIDRYRGRIYGMIKSFFTKNKLKNLNFDDYYQSCFLTFTNCLKLCDDNYNFRNYLKIAIDNNIKEASILMEEIKEVL